MTAKKFGYLVVEGPHDVAFVARLLKPLGFALIRDEYELDPFFHPLIPRTFPYQNDLCKRMPVPTFLQSESHVLAIQSAEGDTQLISTLEEDLTMIATHSLCGIGLICDADDQSPDNRYNAIAQLLRDSTTIKVTADFIAPATIHHQPNSPNWGMFVLPDNCNGGTLETLLLLAGASVYPNLLKAAQDYVAAVPCCNELRKDDKKQFNKPAGEHKATVGAMANVLRPGKAVQVSIQDNRWLNDQTLEIQPIKAVKTFLHQLFDLP